MKSMISVDNSVQKDTMDNMSKTITTIFDSAMQNHISQENVGKALDLMADVCIAGDISISDCTLSSNCNNKSEVNGVPEKYPDDDVTGMSFGTEADITD